MRILTTIDEAAIAELRGRDEFFWLDLERPSDADVERLGALFSLHPLALEDTRKFGQRPKLEEYDGWAMLVFYAAEGAALVECHLYVSGAWVLMVRNAPCAAVEAVRRRLEAREHVAEQFVVYAILDALTDTFFPVLEAIDDDLDALEDAVVAGENVQDRILTLKRRLVALRRVVAPQRDIFARAIDELTELPGLEPAARDYFRDVYDHLIRISDLIDTYRDLLSSLLDVYLTTVSNRLNVVTTQLTVVATIFLPLTFLTGFFGQNFAWLVRGISGAAAFWSLGIGLLALTTLALLLVFRRRGLLR